MSTAGFWPRPALRRGGQATRGVEAHRLRARERGEVILDALQLGGADPLRPLIAELVKDRLALAEHAEAAPATV